VTTATWSWRRGMVGFPLLLVLSFRYKLIQNLSGENEKLYLCIVVVSLALPMDKHLSEWKHSIELIWSAAAPDYGEAACLAAEIARASTEAILRQAATQALPILRSASSGDADHSTQDAARRRLGVIREVLHTLTVRQAREPSEVAHVRGALPADARIAARPPPVRAGNPPGLETRGQDRAPGRRRQHAEISGALGRARCADKASEIGAHFVRSATLRMLVSVPQEMRCTRFRSASQGPEGPGPHMWCGRDTAAAQKRRHTMHSSRRHRMRASAAR